MKKLITYTTFCLIAILFLPSCKSKMGITKRHYSNGYYVSHTKSKNKTTIVKQQTKKVEADNMVSINVLSTKPENIKDQVALQPKESIMASAFPNKKGSTYSENKVSYKSVKINNPTKEFKKAISKIGSGDGERDALSLFWIVILVIVLLWALGLIAGGFGLGGLINLLLVIALILFILWLLRVV